MNASVGGFLLVWYETDRSTGWGWSDTGAVLLQLAIVLLVLNLIVSLIRFTDGKGRHGRRGP